MSGSRFSQSQLDRAARKFWQLMHRHRLGFVFAESCTGGLLAATLTRVPGVSELFCGSWVVYQLESKSRWLGVPWELLESPGPVSAEVAQAMAQCALKRTPAAQVAVATTGHLGPQAPKRLDGVLYVAAARGDRKSSPKCALWRVKLLRPHSFSPEQLRRVRQRQAVHAALEHATAWLSHILKTPSA